MILVLTILSLALLGTLGCIATLVYVTSKEHKASRVVTNFPAELTRTYFQASWRALAEDAINSSETYLRLSRPDRIAVAKPSQSYHRALVGAGG
jgi:hypothetical protein